LNRVTLGNKRLRKSELFVKLFGQLIEARKLVIPWIAEISVQGRRLRVLYIHTGFHRVLGDTVEFRAEAVRHIDNVVDAGPVETLAQIGNRRAVFLVLAVCHGKKSLGQSFVFVPGRHFVYRHATVFTVRVGVSVASDVPVLKLLFRNLGGSNLDSCFHVNLPSRTRAAQKCTRS